MSHTCNKDKIHRTIICCIYNYDGVDESHDFVKVSNYRDQKYIKTPKKSFDSIMMFGIVFFDQNKLI